MMTSLIRLHEPSSIPFISETSSASGGMSGVHSVRHARSVCAGTASTTRSAPSSAAATSVVAVSADGSVIPGRYLGFSCRPLIASAISALRAQMRHRRARVAEHLRERGAPRTRAEHRRLHAEVISPAAAA